VHHQLTWTAEPAHNGSRPLYFEAFGQTRLPILTTLGGSQPPVRLPVAPRSVAKHT